MHSARPNIDIQRRAQSIALRQVKRPRADICPPVFRPLLFRIFSKELCAMLLHRAVTPLAMNMLSKKISGRL
jgi:hypothetical protein